MVIRGRCPTLSDPMPTRDGLLVRLMVSRQGLTPSQAAAIAHLAGNYGNGQIEITARGKLQLRGLSESTLPDFTKGIVALDLGSVEGFVVEVGPLCGLCTGELRDPRLLASAIESDVQDKGLAVQLHPKVSVLVDGGGPCGLNSLSADIRLHALGSKGWALGVGGTALSARWLGFGAEETICAATIGILRALAGCRRRARDIETADLMALAKGLQAHRPVIPASEDDVGGFPLNDGSHALGLALAFGRTDAQTLASFCKELPAGAELRAGPGGRLVAIGLDRIGCKQVLEAAHRAGFVADPDDARLSITACIGAAGCAHAHLDTQKLADALARSGLTSRSQRVHLSGCEKGCGAPRDGRLILTGDRGGHRLGAGDAEAVLPLARWLLEQGEACRVEP